MTPAQAAIRARGLKPAAQLAADRPHGDRLRYIAGCRCSECRAANSAYERSRIAARRAGDWNGFVSAARARAHMLALAKQGVGRRAIGAASDVADSILSKIRSGERQQIRARTERAILAVTPAMVSDHACIDAGPSWCLITELLKAGFTKTRLAHELGMQGHALQLGKDQITAGNAYKVERMHARLMGADEALIDAAPTWRLINVLRSEWYRDEQIARELGWADGVLHIDRRRVTRALAGQVEQLHRRLMA